MMNIQIQIEDAIKGLLELHDAENNVVDYTESRRHVLACMVPREAMMRAKKKKGSVVRHVGANGGRIGCLKTALEPNSPSTIPMNDDIKLILVQKRGSLQRGSGHKLGIVPNALKDGAVIYEAVLFKNVAVCRTIGLFLFLDMSKKFCPGSCFSLVSEL